MSSKIARVLILAVVALALAGCGKKGAPQPPPDQPNTYPRRRWGRPSTSIPRAR
jgi:predicted small lipoprotein YifL